MNTGVCCHWSIKATKQQNAGILEILPSRYKRCCSADRPADRDLHAVDGTWNMHCSWQRLNEWLKVVHLVLLWLILSPYTKCKHNCQQILFRVFSKYLSFQNYRTVFRSVYSLNLCSLKIYSKICIRRCRNYLSIWRKFVAISLEKRKNGKDVSPTSNPFGNRVLQISVHFIGNTAERVVGGVVEARFDKHELHKKWLKVIVTASRY